METEDRSDESASGAGAIVVSAFGPEPLVVDLAVDQVIEVLSRFGVVHAVPLENARNCVQHQIYLELNH